MKGIIGCFLILVSICSHSHAALIYLSGNPFDDRGNSTVDISEQLEWLDVTVTLGRSYNDVLADTVAEGSPLFGWRFANRNEFKALLGNVLASAPVWSYYEDIDFYDTLLTSSVDAPALFRFVEMFGNTIRVHSQDLGVKYTGAGIHGALLSESGDPYMAVVHDYGCGGASGCGLSSYSSSWAIPYGRSEGFNHDLAQPWAGAFLVRTVSVLEPTSIFLILLGLLGLRLGRVKSAR